MKRYIDLTLSTDSEADISVLIRDLEMELNCCWNTFDIERVVDHKPILIELEKKEECTE